MSTHASRPAANQRLLVYLVVFLLAGCSRTPSFDILGSFFPAWLVCFAAASLLTALARLILMRLHMKLDLPVLAYPALAALLTFSLWLMFFY
jgi:YtcA-like protein